MLWMLGCRSRERQVRVVVVHSDHHRRSGVLLRPLTAAAAEGLERKARDDERPEDAV